MNESQQMQSKLPVRIFRKSLPFRMTFQEVIRALKLKDNERCLTIGDETGLFGCQLCKLGGEWVTVVSGETQAGLVRSLIDGDVDVLDDQGKLPFDDKQFDVILVLNFLEKMRDDAAFIEECHRVLKNDGRIIVNVTNRKAVSIINPLSSLLGISYERRGLARPGYLEPEMFNILKNGFDVSNMRTYMRCFVMLVDTFVQAAIGKQSTAGDLERAVRCYSIAAPFYWLAFQLDLFLFMTKGYSLICSAKRRAWLPRKTPVLSDGRRISEAVLSRAID